METYNEKRKGIFIPKRQSQKWLYLEQKYYPFKFLLSTLRLTKPLFLLQCVSHVWLPLPSPSQIWLCGSGLIKLGRITPTDVEIVLSFLKTFQLGFLQEKAYIHSTEIFFVYISRALLLLFFLPFLVKMSTCFFCVLCSISDHQGSIVAVAVQVIAMVMI